jgi:hypothetical protein
MAALLPMAARLPHLPLGEPSSRRAVLFEGGSNFRPEPGWKSQTRINRFSKAFFCSFVGNSPDGNQSWRSAVRKILIEEPFDEAVCDHPLRDFSIHLRQP